MRALSFLKIAAIALSLTTVGRYASLEWESFGQKRITANLCHAVGNYLETGAIRDAFENLKAGAERSGQQNACVSVLDHGRSYSTNCIDPEKSYNTTLCRAEANSGVSAQILYPKENFFGAGIFKAWIALIFCLSGLLLSARWVALELAKLVTDELQKNILHKERGISFGVRRILSGILEKAGIVGVIRRQTAAFEKQLSTFEEKERVALVLKAEAEKNLEFIEKVRQIRHDIRSPLSSLMAIRSELRADPEVESALSYSISSIEGLIDRLGEELNTDAPRLSIAEVLLEETVASLSVKFRRAKNVTLKLDYNRESLSPIKVIPTEFQRVIENLLENAFDAVTTSGEISLTVTSNASQCFVVIEDDGCGIPDDVRANLFLAGATFGKVNGGGQGLRFVKSKIESWGGQVSYGPLQQGSRFEILLPLMQTGVVFVGAVEPSQLLVIDDDESTPFILEARGYEIEDVAATFEEGKSLMDNHRSTDLPILVDEDLGGGLRGTDLLRAVGATKTTFLCTNDYDNPDVIRRAKAVGVRITPKPLYRLARPIMAAASADRAPLTILG